MRREYMPAHQKDAYTSGVLIPCGHCMICRCNRAAEWSARLVHESLYHNDNSFITLTYDDEHIPYSPFGLFDLNKKHLQNFFKRARKYLHPKKIRYFAVGEYGSQTQRSHYHAIIFGHRFDCDELETLWKAGLSHVGSASERSIYYTAGYLLKNYERRNNIYGRVESFNLCSRGLGLDFALAHKERIQKGEMTAEGRQVAIPRYYRKKIEIDKKNLKYQSAQREYAIMRRKFSNGALTEYEIEDYTRVHQQVMEARKLHLAELLTKIDRSKNRTKFIQ